MMFFVKVRIDVDKLIDLGQKIQTGEYDRSHIRWTFCLKEDPAIGINLYEADTAEDFEAVMAQHKPYFKEVLEISPVISTQESMRSLMISMNQQFTG